jgi:hypothetical protein
MRAAISDLRRRADQARRLAIASTSNDTRDHLLTAARNYERQAADLEKALTEDPRSFC